MEWNGQLLGSGAYDKFHGLAEALFSNLLCQRAFLGFLDQNISPGGGRSGEDLNEAAESAMSTSY